MPAPASTVYVERLARSESPAFTTRRARRAEITGASHDPIVWAKAQGSNVEDVDGNVFVDLTGGFGTAASGFNHPEVSRAVAMQIERLPFALGDLYPSDVKIDLLEELAKLAAFPNPRVALGVNGADAVEIALKTAALSTGRPGVVFFDGGYHGLSYGAVSVCGLGEGFRAPFEQQLNPHTTVLPFPTQQMSPTAAQQFLNEHWPVVAPGAVVVEPVQARGGVRPAPEGFLSALRRKCSAEGTILVADEIYTGLGRTGAWFASLEAEPDIICLGKALGGGFPISACIGQDAVMAAWGAPTGAALHTGTYYGHPPSCAASMAQLRVIKEERLVERSARVGARLMRQLQSLTDHPDVVEVRGVGLLLGIEIAARGGVSAGARCLSLVRQLLECGYVVLPAGGNGSVLQLSPALNIDESLLDGFVMSFGKLLS